LTALFVDAFALVQWITAQKHSPHFTSVFVLNGWIFDGVLCQQDCDRPGRACL